LKLENAKNRKERGMKRVLKYVPIWAFVLLIIAVICVALHTAALISPAFADFFNIKIASFFRFLFGKITTFFPFSLAEILIILSPVIIGFLIFLSVRLIKATLERKIRFLVALVAATTFFYSTFVLTFACGYSGKPLEEKLSLQREDIDANEIYQTIKAVATELSRLSGEVTYGDDGFSVMPYSFSELNAKLNECYGKAGEKYGFITPFKCRTKPVILSKAMTYTHISGVYTFFTGEANVNVNYPDYVLPYTALHEMAHQRGIAREDEANFVAFLVGLESDDAYIKYSAYFGAYEYLLSALYRADKELFISSLEFITEPIYKEMLAYTEFFKKYDDNLIADVSEGINNAYLISQGQSEGTRSYGLVTELLVAYYKTLN
jgi:hypothetical protein